MAEISPGRMPTGKGKATTGKGKGKMVEQSKGKGTLIDVWK